MHKQLLHQLSQYTADFIKNKTGKGPKDIKCHYSDNKIYIEMFRLLTPIELEIATIPTGIASVKSTREDFFEKYAQDFQNTAGRILNCQITHSASLWDVVNDEAFIILTYC